MLHRLAAMLIVIFWMCMTGLLVFKQIYPQARLNDVPVGIVTQIIFQHQQASDLQIYDGPKEAGYLHVQPTRNAQTGDLNLDFHGNLGVNIPGGDRQRLSWVGSMDMNPNLRIQRFRVNIAFQQGGGQLDLVVEPPKNIAHYTVKSGTNPAEQSDLTLDEAGFTSLLNRTGLGAVALPQIKAASSQISAPVFVAQTASLQLNGETVPTFFFSMKMDDQSIIEAHLSELGQVLRAQIPLLGYKFAPQNVAP